MGWFSDAWDDIGDNLSLVGTSILDVAANLTPGDAGFLSGDARYTAAEVEQQLAEREGRAYDEGRAKASAEGGLSTIVAATKETEKNVGTVVADAVDDAVKAAGTALDLLTNPWVLGGVAVVVGLILAAPYLAPVVAKAVR